MKYVFWLLKAIIFIALFAFALGNLQNVTVNFLLSQPFTLPLVLVILASFALGAVLGVVVMLPRWWQLRRSARSAQQQVRDARSALGTAADAAAPGNPVPPPDQQRDKTDPAIPLQP